MIGFAGRGIDRNARTRSLAADATDHRLGAGGAQGGQSVRSAQWWDTLNAPLPNRGQLANAGD